MRAAAVLVALIFVPALVPALVAAQSGPSQLTLSGHVVDMTHAAVLGASVTIVGEDRASAPVVVVTDQTGTFTAALAPGRYKVRVMVAGFRESVQDIALREGSTQTREFVLDVDAFKDSVTVNAPAGYTVPAISSATKTPTPLRDVPQAVTVVTKELIHDQMMMSVGDVMRYVPGIGVHQGENNRDQVIIRGNSSSADFFVDGVRDDVQYYRDLYNVDRVEALKGPNAMIFGRGGGGGVVNRVFKEALFMPHYEVGVQGGEYGNKRLTADLDQPVNEKVALRVNGMMEDSGSFRNGVTLNRYGVTPTVTFAASDRTKVVASYEYLNDSRVADRGITSFQGRPVDVDRSTFYGNPADSDVRADVNVASATVEHRATSFTLRNRTMVGNYDRGYQNYVPGAVTPNQQQVALTAYNNATDRTNLFNQTDLTSIVSTGSLRHTLLAGAEFGRQSTDNFRNTGFFNNTATTILVPYSAPTITTPVTYRQSATDADNHVGTNVAATYVQDQVEVSPHLQLLGGVRYDYFDLEYHNNRNGDTLGRVDNLVSPRAGIVYKPVVPVSVYGNYSVSYLPSSGDQFSSLTVITEQVKPEQFTNYEVGAKWDVRPALSLTTAVYRLDRTNTRATDPNDPTRIVQTGSQRTNGYELGINGALTPAWKIAGGYAYQNAFVSSATAAARAGAIVGQVPRNTFSLWNNYQVHPRVGLGLGVLYRSDMFATIDNTVVLPAYTRADVAAFVRLTREVRLQLNVENLFDANYYTNADSNTNISFGFPRAVRVGVTTSF
jgi:catecholate siderophore receptor